MGLFLFLIIYNAPTLQHLLVSLSAGKRRKSIQPLHHGERVPGAGKEKEQGREEIGTILKTSP